MKAIPIDREHFGYEPRIGDTVCIRMPESFNLRDKRHMNLMSKSRSVNYMVTSLNPLMAQPVSVTHVRRHLLAGVVSIKTRRIHA